MNVPWAICVVGMLLYGGLFLASRGVIRVLERIAASLKDISSEIRRRGP